jgi:hypothetical protein
MLFLSSALRADQTVTLAAREFGRNSPAAAFGDAFGNARRRAADTTAAWNTAPDDLPAWGPALIFPLFGSGLSSDTVLALAASLEGGDSAPQLIWRTLGLYAAKSRVPFEDTPKLLAVVNRNLKAINRAARDIDAFVDTRELKEWGPVGLGAWVAFLNLLFRDYWDLGDPGAQSWNADGLKITRDLLTRARRSDGRGFRFALRSDTLALWPNALMLHALVKAYENEELIEFETAAIDVVQALDALRDGDGAYFSTEERADKSLRANAYLAGALLLLAKDTGASEYRDRAVAIVRWLTSAANVPLLMRDAGLETHVGYLILLLDSVATQPFENILGRRPMRAAPPAAPALPLAELRPADSRYRALFDATLDTLLNRSPRAHGDFAYDYGDAPGYATEVLLAAQQTDAVRDVLARQQALLAWPRPRYFDEIAFGGDAFIATLAHPDVLPPDAAAAALRRAMLFSGALAMIDRYDMSLVDWFTGGGGFEYGPTVIGAQLAHGQFAFAQAFPGQRVGWVVHPGAVGRALVDTAGSVAWDETQHAYRARPGDGEIRLLPNAMMILANLEAHAASRDQAYVDRAVAVAAGLDALWDPGRGAYFADATTVGPEGYLSLSTNTYAALALHRLATVTGDAAHRGRALAVLDFIQRELFADGVIYHHVYRGRRSAGDIWCSGCNWRVLSVLRAVQ